MAKRKGGRRRQGGPRITGAWAQRDYDPLTVRRGAAFDFSSFNEEEIEAAVAKTRAIFRESLLEGGAAPESIVWHIGTQRPPGVPSDTKEGLYYVIGVGRKQT